MSVKNPQDDLQNQLKAAALSYHEFPVRGKISVTPTKQLTCQRDLSLAYSPGVAAACEEIAAQPADVSKYTARANLVAVVTNGSAVLGLGNIGPLAAKPVMEGKAVLFKKFAGIDVFDIEINESDPDKLCAIIAALEPTFGGINLEDIKAPECFYIERQLRARMNIPVFHDDQHGTAIIVSAAILNGLQVVGKSLDSCKLVVSGAGAAALACLELLVDLGFPLANIFVCDLAGVVYQGRTELMDEEKARYAQATDARTLAEIITDADVFLGLSAGGVLTQAMVKMMASKPIILALANPRPEILPEDIRAVRDDAIIATGRSDYPNQVNNVLCFPYVFRGALDCGATTITRSMEIAAVHALAALAQAEQSDLAAAAYDNHHVAFGENHLIPLPFDPRLMSHIAPAVARAAMVAGVATRPIDDLAQYAQKLSQFAYHSGSFMQPIFNSAKKAPIANKRIVFTEGEDERVLRAVQIILDEQLAKPILIGRPHTIKHLLKQFGLRFKLDSDVTIISPDLEGLYDDFWRSYWLLAQRKGVTEPAAQLAMRRQHSLIGAMLVKKGLADGMICGTSGDPDQHLHEVDLVLGKRAATSVYAAMNYLLLADRQIALVDTHFNQNPSAAELAEITLLAAEQMRHFGLPPRVALLSHSNFGSHQHGSASKMREVLALVKQFEPGLEIDGEMQGDTALDFSLLTKQMPQSGLTASANLLVFPNIEAANISYNLLKTAAGNGIAVGPILLGCASPVQILTPHATVRRIVNMTAMCVVEVELRRTTSG